MESGSITGRGENWFTKKEREKSTWERERESWPVWPANPTRNPRSWPNHISHFRPPHWSSLVSIWSLEADYHIPAVFVVGNRPERRQFELENLRPRSVFAAVDPAGFLAHHHLDLIPQLTLITFRLITTTRDAVFVANDHWKTHGFSSFDSPPASRVATHGHHRWTHRGLNYQS